MNKRVMADRRRVAGLFMLCWLVYFSSYLGRLNFSGVMSQMIHENLFDKSHAGLINTVFFITYALGQLINGILGDRCSPRSMLFIGCMGAGVCNILGGMATEFSYILLLRACNGYFMAMLWPPIIRVFAEMLAPDDMVRCSIHMSSAVAAGNLAAYLLASAMLNVQGWQAAFWVPGLWMVIMGILWFFAFGSMQKYCRTNGRIIENDAAANHAPEGKPALSFWKMLAIPGVLMCIVPVIMNGVLKDGVTSWIPTYITEVFGLKPAFAVLVTTLLPIVNLSGAAAAQWVYNKISKNELRASALFFALASAALGALMLWGKTSVIFTLMLFALITASMLAISTLIVSILPLRFERYGRASSLSGAMNAIAYLGSAAAAAAIGFLSERFGWGATIFSWCAITVTAFIFCIVGSKCRMYVKE